MSKRIQTKRCSYCKQIKLISEFHRNKSCKDGLSYYCKSCQIVHIKTCRRSEKGRTTRKRYQQSKKGRIKIQVYLKRYRQSQKGKATEKRYLRQYRQIKKFWLRRLFTVMLQRCNNSKQPNYKYYGGRGIKVKFNSFNNFYNYVMNDLKVDPRGLTIDRIDNNGHYEPGNIRFVTQAENNRNR